MTVHIVLGGECTEFFQLEDYNEKDIIIGVDRGALRLVKNEYAIDVAIGDFDSVNSKELQLIHKKAKKIYQFKSEKDDTDAELAIDWVKRNYSQTPAKIYCWDGGRVDHLLSLIYLIYQPRFKMYIPKIEWISPKNCAKFYLPGEYKIEKNKQYKYFSVISLTPIKRLAIHQAKYNLPPTDFSYPRALISNEFIKDTFYLSFSSGIVLLLRTRDEK